MTSVNIGLNENARKSVADALNKTLADTYALYMKTHAYHWNVTGPQFHSLHVMFEEQYREMWAALDEIAETGSRPWRICAFKRKGTRRTDSY